MFVVGMVLFGVSVIQNDILPRLGGLLLIVGTFVFTIGGFAGAAEPIISVIGAAITGSGFVWLGIPLLFKKPKLN